MAASKKNKGGHPKSVIDLDLFRKLCQMQCTEMELAGFFGVSLRTIKRRVKESEYREAWDYGRAHGRASLRMLMWRHAQRDGSSGATMAIHLSKHWLGMTDKAALELSGKVDGQVEVTSARERVTRKIDAIAQRIARRVDSIAIAAGASTGSREPV